MTRLYSHLFRIISVLLGLFILVEVNYPQLAPQAQLSVFALLGLCLVFLKYPIHSNKSLHIPRSLFRAGSCVSVLVMS